MKMKKRLRKKKHFGEFAEWGRQLVNMRNRKDGFDEFLDDSSQAPHVKASKLYDAFGVKPSTGQTKSKQVRNILKMTQFDQNWTLPSKMERNLMVPCGLGTYLDRCSFPRWAVTR